MPLQTAARQEHTDDTFAAAQ